MTTAYDNIIRAVDYHLDHLTRIEMNRIIKYLVSEGSDRFGIHFTLQEQEPTDAKREL